MKFSSEMLALEDWTPPDDRKPLRTLLVTIERANPHKWECTFKEGNDSEDESKKKYRRNSGKRTLMDLDFSSVPAKADDYVKIVLKIHEDKQNKMYFTRADENGKRVSITAGSQISWEMLRHLREEPVDPKVRCYEVSFLCRLVPTPDRTKDDPLLPFNVGLTILDDRGNKDLEFPVFFDPKVQNGGE